MDNHSSDIANHSSDIAKLFTVDGCIDLAKQYNVQRCDFEKFLKAKTLCAAFAAKRRGDIRLYKKLHKLHYTVHYLPRNTPFSKQIYERYPYYLNDDLRAFDAVRMVIVLLFSIYMLLCPFNQNIAYMTILRPIHAGFFFFSGLVGLLGFIHILNCINVPIMLDNI
jgi:hypothetical protein